MLFVSLLLCCGLADASEPVVGPAPPPVWQAYGIEHHVDPLSWRAQPPALIGDRAATLELRMQVPESFHLYRDRLHVEVVDPGPLTIGEILYPEGE